MWHPELPERQTLSLSPFWRRWMGAAQNICRRDALLLTQNWPQVFWQKPLVLLPCLWKPWSQKCRLKTFTNCCVVPVFDWLKLEWLRFNQHHHKVSTGRCAVPQIQGHEASNLNTAMRWGSCVWLFSVWAFCCHMWALHELHNLLKSLTRIISKMIWKIIARMRIKETIWMIFEETFPFTKKIWEIMLRLNGPTFAVLSCFWCPHSKNTQPAFTGIADSLLLSWHGCLEGKA